jgi:hypothetical protein
MGEAYFISNCRERGVGVFARRNFSPGDYILAFRGKVLQHTQIADFTHCLEIDVGIFLGPSGKADDHINHSCEPNCAVIFEDSEPVLCALTEINKNDEFTFDYSTMMFTDPTSFECHCGSRRCRQRIGNFHTLPTATRRRYVALNMIPAFILAAAACESAALVVEPLPQEA